MWQRHCSRIKLVGWHEILDICGHEVADMVCEPATLGITLVSSRMEFKVSAFAR